jgi:hypothetical protein
MSLERTRAAGRRRVELHPVPDDDPSVRVLRVGHAAVLLRALAAAVAGADVLDELIVAHFAMFFLFFLLESDVEYGSTEQITVRFRQHLKNEIPYPVNSVIRLDEDTLKLLSKIRPLDKGSHMRAKENMSRPSTSNKGNTPAGADKTPPAGSASFRQRLSRPFEGLCRSVV